MGICQKGLLHKLQIAQNEGIHKLMGVFKTTLMEPLHNMMGIPPIPYLVNKLMHAYSNRLQGLPPNALVCTILTHDQCCYWPDHVHPTTNLSQALANLSPYTARSWEHPCLIYLPNPPPYITSLHKESMECLEA